MALDAQWSAVARGYRHAWMAAVVLGAGSVAAAIATGKPLAGVFACVGLALGGWNSRKLWDDTSKLTGSEPNPKQHVVMSSGRRLGLVTLIAFLIAVAYRGSNGWVVFVGLVAFQFVMMVMLLRPLRQVTAKRPAVTR